MSDLLLTYLIKTSTKTKLFKKFIDIFIYLCTYMFKTVLFFFVIFSYQVQKNAFLFNSECTKVHSLKLQMYTVDLLKYTKCELNFLA